MMSRRSRVVRGSSTDRSRVAGCASSRLRMLIPAPSDELDPARGESDHLQQQPAVPPALNIGLSITPRAIADGNLHDLEIEARGTEQQVEIAERVEVPEVGAVVGNSLVIGAPQDFRTA